MGVTFGRLGTTTINRGSRLIITPDFRVIVPEPPPPANDYVPNPVNWGNVDYNGINGEFSSATQQVTGISDLIYLRVNYNSPAIIAYKIDTSLPDYTGMTSPSFLGFATVEDNSTVEVSPDDYLTFCIDEGGTGGDYGPITVTIRNTNDSETILDTFNATVTGMS